MNTNDRGTHAASESPASPRAAGTGLRHEGSATSDPKWIEVTNSEPGYAHTRLSGNCGPAVTVADIQAKFYDRYFGGREAWVRDGQWGAVRHDD